MKQEWLLQFKNSWIRVYESRGRLSLDRWVQGRFTHITDLSKESTGSCTAVATPKYLHVVYREAQHVFYALFDGEHLHKKQLFASCDVSSLRLASHGNYVHLFYTTPHKGTYLLMHQLLGEGAKAPVAIMEVCDDAFSLYAHQNGDVTLLLTNKEDVQGTMRYRWSQKGFEAFSPLDCGCKLCRPVLYAEDDRLLVAGFAAFDHFVNILCLEKEWAKSQCTLSAVHLLTADCDTLCLSCPEGVPSLAWCEGGLVMESHMENRNRWKKPKTFLSGNGRENILFHIEKEDEKRQVFGYMKQGVPVFYFGEDFGR